MAPLENTSDSAFSAIRAAVSDMLERVKFATRHALSFDDKRDMNKALGYPDDIGLGQYEGRYERGGVATRIIEAAPKATWSGGITLQEDEDPDIITDFEGESLLLFTRLGLWSRILRADILAGLGHYSTLVIGLGGDLRSEAQGLKDQRGVLWVRALSESHCKITRYITDTSDPRFGLPHFYDAQLGKTNKSTHWSRVLHVAEGLLEDDVVGQPRLRSVWNLLDDLWKIEGGGAEAAWRTMDPGMQVDLDPKLDYKSAEVDKLKDEIDEYINNLRRVIRTRGGKITMLGSSGVVGVDFGSNVDSIMGLISATTGIPQRILSGSERGTLASEQDRSNWDDRIVERKRAFATPLVRKLVDMFIEIGALPEPDQYSVKWSEIDKTSMEDKASVAKTISLANSSQVSIGDSPVMSTAEIRKDIFGKDEEVVLKGLKADLADEEGEPEWRSVHRAADEHRDSMVIFFLKFWEGVSLTGFETALSKGQDEAIKLFDVAMSQAESDIEISLAEEIHESFSAGGTSALNSSRARGSFFATRAAKFEADFDTTNPRALEWSADRSSELITEIGPETRKAVRDLIATGFEEGIPPRRLARDISQVVGLRSDQITALSNLTRRLAEQGLSEQEIATAGDKYAKQLLRQRALLIARTETLRSANAGQREFWLQGVDDGTLPNDQERVWLVTPDERLRLEHALMSGQRRGLLEPFETPDGRFIEPGQDPNCRCAQGLVS